MDNFTDRKYNGGPPLSKYPQSNAKSPYSIRRKPIRPISVLWKLLWKKVESKNGNNCTALVRKAHKKANNCMAFLRKVHKKANNSLLGGIQTVRLLEIWKKFGKILHKKYNYNHSTYNTHTHIHNWALIDEEGLV